MGVLDDAIREHLELKRQHGAPEEELQRQEEEALGPARREVPQEPGMEEATDGHPQTGEEPAPAAAELPEAEGEPAEAAAHLAAPAGEAEPVEDAVEEVGPANGERTHAESPPTEVMFAPAPPPESSEQDELEEEDEPEGEDEEADEGPFGADEPFASEPEDDAAPEEGEDADVLEDTPDFLEETPEHDRLWFEQKPPRDFDFD